MPGPSESLTPKAGGNGAPGASGRPAWISDELIALTIRTWQPHYAEPLTERDAIEMIGNVGRLIGVLTNDRGPLPKNGPHR